MATHRGTQPPQVPRLRALMDSGAMIRHPIEVFERYRADFGATFAFHFGGAKKAVVSSDPAFIEHVLRDATNYHKSEIQIERMGEFQGQGLLSSTSDAAIPEIRSLPPDVTLIIDWPIIAQPPIDPRAPAKTFAMP